jgi:hypothetical protein
VDPKINLAVDTATRPPHTHEFSVAFDRELTQTVRASVAYVGRRGRAYLGWTDVAGQYRTEQQTVAGVTVPVHVLTSPTADRRFLLMNLDNFVMNYDGVVVAGEKRMSNDWYVSASYTYSRVTGLQVASALPVDAGQTSTIAMPEFLTFGQDPNDLTNAYGRLPNDRPHVLRMTGSVRLPWQDIMVAASLGRRRRRCPCHRAAGQSCSSRAAHAVCRLSLFSISVSPNQSSRAGPARST